MAAPQCFTITEPQFEQPQNRSPPLGLRIKPRLASIFRRHRKIDFLNRLPPKSEILDVGCGSNSPYLVKSLFPDCTYTGIDVDDYVQTKPNLADHYVLVDRHRFPDSVLAFGKKFDAVISSHNLEHCDSRDETLAAMMTVLKDDGRLYISFPSETSVTFPSREGCLNYYDDPTHKSVPPEFGAIIDLLSRKGFSSSIALNDTNRRSFGRSVLCPSQYPNAWAACKELGNITDSSLSSGRRKDLDR
jgi:SAM-dependent methyltransferase